MSLSILARPMEQLSLSDSNSSTTPFLSYPREVRNAIYEAYFAVIRHPKHIDGYDLPIQALMKTPLLFASRTVFEEAILVWCKSKTFYFPFHCISSSINPGVVASGRIFEFCDTLLTLWLTGVPSSIPENERLLTATIRDIPSFPSLETIRLFAGERDIISHFLHQVASGFISVLPTTEVLVEMTVVGKKKDAPADGLDFAGPDGAVVRGIRLPVRRVVLCASVAHADRMMLHYKHFGGMYLRKLGKEEVEKGRIQHLYKLERAAAA